jgi:hypothetical protein
VLTFTLRQVLLWDGRTQRSLRGVNMKIGESAK